MGQRIVTAISCISLGVLTAAGVFAQQGPQDQDQQPHAWRRASDVPPEELQPAPPSEPDQQLTQQQGPPNLPPGDPRQGPPPPPLSC